MRQKAQVRSKKYFVFLFTALLIIAILAACSAARQSLHGLKNLFVAAFIAAPLLALALNTKKYSIYPAARLSDGKILMATVGGAASAASMPPFSMPIIMFVTIPALYHFAMKLDKRNAFYFAWIFGAFYQMSNMYWIYKPLLIAGGSFPLLIPPALLVIGAVSGLFTAMSVLLAHQIGALGIRSILAFALSWVTMEYWRSSLLGGFPWGMIGYCWTNSLQMMQIASLIGIYGLSFITVMSATSIALLPRDFKSAFIPMLLIGATFLYGRVRLTTAAEQYNENVRLMLIGSNIEQKYKWGRENLAANFFDQVNATRQILQNKKNHNETQPTYNIALWPETAIPYALSSDVESNFSDLAKLLPQNLDLLIAGAIRSDNRSQWNSAFVIYDKGTKVVYYDKQKLVLLGEYAPSFLPIKKLIKNRRKLSIGATANSISTPNAPTFGMSICYESLMPFELNNNGKPIEWLVNLSNDAWLEGTTAPLQHFEISKMRAIERGTPLVRVANKGVSSVIDAYGRVIARSSGSADSHIVSRLPKSAKKGGLFGRLTDGQYVSMTFISLAAVLIGIYFYKEVL